MQKKRLLGVDYKRLLSVANRYNRIVNNLNTRNLIYYEQRLMPSKSKRVEIECRIKKYSGLRDIYMRKALKAKLKDKEYRDVYAAQYRKRPEVVKKHHVYMKKYMKKYNKIYYMKKKAERNG